MKEEIKRYVNKEEYNEIISHASSLDYTLGPTGDKIPIYKHYPSFEEYESGEMIYMGERIYKKIY